MPEEGVCPLKHDDILSLEEVEHFVRIAANKGIQHIRLTGGEPLVRKGIYSLIQKLKRIPQIESIALTTNGILLPKMAKELKNSGLDRVNISLDSLDPDQYRAITRLGKLEDALAGVDAALDYFSPVKINVVAIRHLQQDLLSFARMTLDRPLHVRFIEYMPIGNTQEYYPPAIKFSSKDERQTACIDSGHIPWSKQDIIPASEILERLKRDAEREKIGEIIAFDPAIKNPSFGQGPASYIKIKGAQGSIGFISAMSDHFCSSCNRIRLTADRKIRPCLFSDKELDIKTALRTGTDAEIENILDETLRIKPKNHESIAGTKRNMNKIGG